MNQSFDDEMVREMFQRLKSVDIHQVPSFDDVLQRPVRVTDRPRARRLRVVGVCFAAGCVLLVALLFTIPRKNGSLVETPPRIKESAGSVEGSQDQHLLDIDFGHLLALVDENLATAETREWPTHTDSLLTVNLDASSFQE